uniref:Glucose-induced degradation protein 8 homolog n=1 Tax=Rhizophora mucronata TaxID=61149 RepID=A0A2P2LFV1_RHIMU
MFKLISKKVITREEWEKKLNDVKIRKEDMNKLVMNFLVTGGYVEAAEKFQIESGTEPDIDLATITDRMAVKRAVQCGNVEDAIKKVNDLNPKILDTNPQLFFHLQQQRMIELIRKGKIEEALEFAQAELAPRGEENGLTSGFYSMKLYIFGDTHKSGNVENFCSKAF